MDLRSEIGSDMPSVLGLVHDNVTFPTRIVYLTNLDYRKGLINFEDLNSDKSYDPSTAFYQVIVQPRC